MVLNLMITEEKRLDWEAAEKEEEIEMMQEKEKEDNQKERSDEIEDPLKGMRRKMEAL